MSYFICSKCDARHEIFSHGGGERACETLHVPFSGRIPLELEVRQSGDAGVPLIQRSPQSASAQAFLALAETLHKAVSAQSALRRKRETRSRALPIIRS